MLLGQVEREKGGTESANRLGFSLFRWNIKLSLSAHALLTFIGPLKKANVTRPRGECSVCFALNTLHTDCRAGMVWRPQTVCRPWRSPPCPTLVPLRQYAKEGSITPCHCLKKPNVLSLRQCWKTETGLRQSSLTDKLREVGKKEREMGINKEMTMDERYGRGWQPSMKKTAGSDILHKPGDTSGMMEATTRDMERGKEEE